MERDRVFGGEDLPDNIDLEPMLQDLGIEVKSESDYAYLILCPYHSNFHTPAATIAKSNGFLFCYSGECEKRFSLMELVQDIKGLNFFQAKRYINKHAQEARSLDEVLEEIYATNEELPEFPESTLKSFQDNFAGNESAQEYILSRDIYIETANYFGIGYDPTEKMVVTPMRAVNNKLIGLIGRSIVEKKFKNSNNLPSSKSLFNIQHAKKSNTDSVVLVESNFDAIRAHQAGFPNTVATLGGSFSEYHLSQISKYFNSVILGVDNDEAGQKLAKKIAIKCSKANLSVYQARYSEAELFPDDAKDFGDLIDQEIAHMIRNASIFEV